MSSPADNYGLFQNRKNFSKNEIIRGYNSYRDVIKSSKTKISGKVKVLYKIDKSESTEYFSVPRRVINLKVGFLVSKKIFTKAVTRNKIKRQLKESYRNLKGKYIIRHKPKNKISILFSLSPSGTDYVKKYGKLDFAETKRDIDKLLDKIFKEPIRYN